MSPEKKSKRQERRQKIKQQQDRSRLLTLGLITVGALFIVFAIVWPQLKPIADIVAVDPDPRPEANGTSMGDPNAPIQITIFSDFQCPYCDRFYTDTEHLLVQYYVSTGKVFFTYRSAGNWVSNNIAQSQGTPAKTESQDSAQAAYCAADQGKFWEMHDALFENNRDVEDQGSFTSRRLTAIAKSVGLDMNQYRDCYNSNKYADQVQKDLSEAVAANIQGTPFFVITYKVNGETQTTSLDGAQPFSTFQTKLEGILNEIGG